MKKIFYLFLVGLVCAVRIGAMDTDTTESSSQDDETQISYPLVAAVPLTAQQEKEAAFREAAATFGSDGLTQLKEIFKTGVAIDARDGNGYTALHYACYAGSAKKVDWLMRHHASLESCSERGERPLHCAVYNNAAQCVELLLRKGVQINALSEDSYSPLYTAVVQGCALCIPLLMEAGADPFQLIETKPRPLSCVKVAIMQAMKCKDWGVIDCFLREIASWNRSTDLSPKENCMILMHNKKMHKKGVTSKPEKPVHKRGCKYVE